MRKLGWNTWVILGMFAFLCVTVVGGAVGQDPVARERAAWDQATTIKADELCDALQFFSHEGMAGRGTVDGGSEFPSLFLRREMRRMGLTPKGDLISATVTDRGVTENISYFQDFKWNERIPSRNVLGAIEGEKKDEWVILGAHYDHVGKGEWGARHQKDVGKIHFGADDNGSGTVATLAVAECFARLAQKGVKPKRSILICFWGAEEVGLVGSTHFANHLPKGVDKEKIIGYINLDMVGRNDPKELFVLCGQVPNGREEADAEKCSELYAIAEKVNKEMRLEFTISHRDDENGFERSDQWSFYQVLRNGGRRIPQWQFFTGEHPDYHTPTDTWDKIDYLKLARVAKLAFGLAWHVSQMDGVPSYK